MSLSAPLAPPLLVPVAPREEAHYGPEPMSLLLALFAAVAAVGWVVPGQDRDQQLVARAARGDREALRALYDAHAAQLLAIALRVLRVRAEAEEVVQETFLEVWRRAGEYAPARGTVRAWLSTIAHTRAVDRLRARSRADRLHTSAAEAPEEPSTQPIELASRRQEQERLNAALAVLPADQRRVLQLAYYEGLTQREIAEHTGEPLGTVKTRMRLGMQKLATLLGEVRG